VTPEELHRIAEAAHDAVIAALVTAEECACCSRVPTRMAAIWHMGLVGPVWGPVCTDCLAAALQQHPETPHLDDIVRPLLGTPIMTHGGDA
jgi:hypothetical protein